jgi:diphosphomevalonate decarboxylase
MTTAVAHPNIALVKYWGKQDKPGNLPVAPNLSVTLDSLITETSVTEHIRDEVLLDGTSRRDAKIEAFVADLRQQFDLPPMRIDSRNNFPTGAGLASSASGFAALMTAVNHHFDLDLDRGVVSEWARRGSASAARSVFSGFVALLPPLWRAYSVASPEHWPLKIVVAIVDERAKTVSSTQGMRHSRDTSPFYSAWVEQGSDDYSEAADAIASQDFDGLAHIAEHNCLKMHSVMLTSRPALRYWNAATVTCMESIIALRNRGTPVFFTIDAGPQVKAVCLPEAAENVERELAAVPGVKRTVVCGLGDGARVVLGD